MTQSDTLAGTGILAPSRSLPSRRGGERMNNPGLKKAPLPRRAVLTAGATALAIPLIGRAAMAADMTAINNSQYDAFTVLASDPRFSTFVGLLQQSGLAPEARGSTPFTVFVPTNRAYDKYPGYVRMLLPAGANAFPDTTKLVGYIRMHAVVGLHPPAAFVGHKVELSSVSGVPIMIDGTGSGAPVVTYRLPDNQSVVAHLIANPIMANNALIYPIDDPILMH